MNYNLEIQKLLVKAEDVLPHDRINLLKQAANLADANNDIDWGYELRLQIMDESMGKLKDTEALPAFVWILEAYDANPDRFNTMEMLWKYKWMIDSSARCHFISMEQLEKMLEDYRQRLLDKGFGLRSYYNISASVAFIIENLERAKRCLDARDKIEPDDVCDNPSHELYDMILYYLMIKDTATAMSLERALFALTHPVALFPIDCGYAEYLVRCGKIESAKHFIERAEKSFTELNKQCWLSVSLSGLIYALTFIDPEKAWRYVSDYINWITECQDYDALIFGMNIMPLLKRGGTRTLYLSHEFPVFRDDNVYEVKNLFDYFYGMTLNLAERFDARNGNSSFKSQLIESVADRATSGKGSILRRIVKKLFGK